MYQIKQSEATAARRRLPVLMVSSTDGFSPSTGVVTPTITISKNGATGASGAGTWTEIGNGQYYYELTTGECDTLGWIALNVQKAGSRQYNAICQVMAYDYAVGTNLGLSALPTANPNAANGIITFGTGTGQLDVVGGRADADVLFIAGAAVNTANAQIGVNVVSMASGAVASIWNALTSGLTTVGSIGKLLVDNVNATISSRSTLTAANVWDYLTSAATTVGSLGKLLVDNLNATISSRATDTGVWAAGTRTLTSGANISLAKGTGVTGFNDIAAVDPWNVLASNVTTASSIGLQLKTNIDTTISSRMATFTYTAPPSAATIATQVWSEPIPGSFGVGTAGAKLNSASSAGDPWTAALSTYTTPGTAGYIVNTNLNATVGSRMATFTLPTNFSLLAISGTGGVTVGTNNDKTGYSLSGTQAFNLTGNITGSLSGSVGSVTGNVGGSVASVTGNLGGNVSGSVNSVVGNVGGNVVGSVGSVTGSVGSVSNPATIWDQLETNITTTNSIGLKLKTNVDAQISSRLASSSYTAAPTTTAIMQALWNQSRATASPTGTVPQPGTFGYYLDSQVSAAGGGTGGGGVIIKTGPFTLTSNDLGPNGVLDLVKNDVRNIQLFITDQYGEKIPLNGSYTYSVKTYNAGGTLVSTYSSTLDYATGGLLSFNIDTVTTGTAGTYNVVVFENNGSTDKLYGGLKIEVR